MTKDIPVLKNDAEELPVPNTWRRTFIDIIEAFKDGDYELRSRVDCVRTLSASEAKRIATNVIDYDDQLVSLPADTWQTSIYRWAGDRWQVLVDLFTVRDGASDLVMFVDVHETRDGYCFEVQSVHVP